MGLGEVLGYGVGALLFGGLVWGLIDLLIRTTREPKRKSRRSVLSLLPLPIVPSGESDEKAHREPRRGRLVLQPVPVKNRRGGR
jgi:hypothetical protein